MKLACKHCGICASSFFFGSKPSAQRLQRIECLTAWSRV